jgi:hypothetical protein
VSQTTHQLATSVTLTDPGNLGGAADAAVLADMRAAMAAWAGHLQGLGTLTVQVNISDMNNSSLLADGAPSCGVAAGPLDGRTLVTLSSESELSTGVHMSDQADIVVNINSQNLGRLYLGGGSVVPSGQYDGLSLFEHEIAHGLGFAGETTQQGALGSDEELWDHYLTNIGGVEYFTGPNAEKVAGGPVAVTYNLGNGEDYAHLANSRADPNANDLMSGLGLPAGTSRPISDIDLAILADVGAPITGIAGTACVSGASLEVVGGSGASPAALSLAVGDTGALTSTVVTLTLKDSLGVLGTSRDVGASPGQGGHSLVLAGSLAAVTSDLASLTYTATAPGSDVVQLSILDSYGNSGSGSLTVTVAPAVSIRSVRASADAAGPLDAGHVIRFTLAASTALTLGATSGLALQLSDGGTAAYDAAHSTATSLAFTATVTAGQNSADLMVTGLDLGGASVTDAHGTVLDLGSFATLATGLVIDTAAPAAPARIGLSAATDTGLAGDDVTGAPAPVLLGSAEAGSTVSVREGTSLLGTATANARGAWSLAAAGLAQNSTHALSVTATDAAGNVSAAASCTLTLDSLAPAAPTLSSSTSSGSTLTSTTLGGTAEAGSIVSLADLVGGQVLALGNATAAADGTWHMASAALARGLNLVSATAMDAAGNVSAATSLALTIDAPASSAAPASVPPVVAAVASAAVPAVTVLDAAASSFAAGSGTSIVVSQTAQASVTGAAAASSSMTLFANSGAVHYANGGGTAIVVENGAGTMNLAGGIAGSVLVAFTGAAATRYTGGAGADEIIAGSGALDVTGGSAGSMMVFGGTGSLNFTGGAESDIVVGGAGAATVHAGRGGVFAGAGGSMLFASGTGTFLAGAVDGDQMSASALGGDMMVAGAGNETLEGTLSAAGNLMFGGTGADQVGLGLGADTFVGGSGGASVQMGSGDAQLYLGTGAAQTLSFTAGRTGGSDTVTGFRVGTDHLRLAGYANGPSVAARGSATTIGLADGTSIVLEWVSVRTVDLLLA